jgi:hypothetical protein
MHTTSPQPAPVVAPATMPEEASPASTLGTSGQGWLPAFNSLLQESRDAIKVGGVCVCGWAGVKWARQRVALHGERSPYPWHWPPLLLCAWCRPSQTETLSPCCSWGHPIPTIYKRWTTA